METLHDNCSTSLDSILILILMIFNHILKFSSQLFLICLLHPKIEYTDLWRQYTSKSLLLNSIISLLQVCLHAAILLRPLLHQLVTDLHKLSLWGNVRYLVPTYRNAHQLGYHVPLDPPNQGSLPRHVMNLWQVIWLSWPHRQCCHYVRPTSLW